MSLQQLEHGGHVWTVLWHDDLVEAEREEALEQVPALVETVSLDEVYGAAGEERKWHVPRH